VLEGLPKAGCEGKAKRSKIKSVRGGGTQTKGWSEEIGSCIEIQAGGQGFIVFGAIKSL
jgi:hypothetical protein